MGANHSGRVCPPNPYCPLSRLESSKVKITEASFYCCLIVSCSRPSQGSYKSQPLSESCSYLGFLGSRVPQDRPPPGWMWISIRPIWLAGAEVIRLRSSCSQALRTSSDPSPHPCRHPHPHPAETGNWWSQHTCPGQLYQVCLLHLTRDFLCLNLKLVWISRRQTWGGWTCSALPNMTTMLVNSLVFRTTPLWHIRMGAGIQSATVPRLLP